MPSKNIETTTNQAKDKYNAKQKCRDHNKTDTKKDYLIEDTEI